MRTLSSWDKDEGRETRQEAAAGIQTTAHGHWDPMKGRNDRVLDVFEGGASGISLQTGSGV